MKDNKLVSLVIPLFNEEEVIPLLAERVSKATQMPGVRFELIVVDDGSTDDTQFKLRQWQDRDERVVIVDLSRNWGHQNAYSAGLEVAKGDAVIFMDGDLEDPPELIEVLIAKWHEGNDVVYTVKKARELGLAKRILTSLYYLIIGSMSKYAVEAQAGMYSLVTSRVAQELRDMPERGKSYPNLRASLGFTQTSVSYQRAARACGEPKQTLSRLFGDGLNALFANTYLPIRAFSIFGLFFSVVFLFIAATIFFVRATGWEFWVFHDIPGTALVVIAVLVAGSLQLTFLGVIGEYIARIYEESKGRRGYIIREVIRKESSDSIDNS